MFARLRPVLWELGIASVVINLLALATPLFLMTVYNKVINHGALQTLDVLVLGMVTLFVFEWLLRALRGYIASHTGGRLDAALGSEVVHHLVHLPLRTFEARADRPDPRAHPAARQLRQFFTSQMPLLLVDLAFVGLFVAVLFYLDVRLGAITLAAMPLFWLLSMLARRRQHGAGRGGLHRRPPPRRRASARRSARRSPSRRSASSRRWSGASSSASPTPPGPASAPSNLGGLIASSGQALQHVVALVIVYVGARAIVAGDMSIGALIAATILAARALAPMRQVVGAWQQLQTVRTAFARLDELMDEPSELRRRAGPGACGAAARCRFEEVGLPLRRRGAAGARRRRPRDRARPDAGRGRRRPAPARARFAKLLLGLDQPERGRVLLDDLDLRLWSPAVLRQQIGVVPQEVQLFAGTIAENIALGAVDRSFERIVAAAKFVGAHEFIQRLPEGYETLLGERGSGLSAGQRQLISIARALIRNPRLWCSTRRPARWTRRPRRRCWPT